MFVLCIVATAKCHLGSYTYLYSYCVSILHKYSLICVSNLNICMVEYVCVFVDLCIYIYIHT